jgi:hypothetical protein
VLLGSTTPCALNQHVLIQQYDAMPRDRRSASGSLRAIARQHVEARAGSGA